MQSGPRYIRQQGAESQACGGALGTSTEQRLGKASNDTVCITNWEQTEYVKREG